MSRCYDMTARRWLAVPVFILAILMVAPAALVWIIGLAIAGDEEEF